MGVQLPPLAPTKKGASVVIQTESKLSACSLQQSSLGSFKFCKGHLSFTITAKHGDYFYDAAITVPQSMVDSIFNRAVKYQSEKIQSIGFKNSLDDYVAITFKQSIVEYTKEFLLRFCVLDFLYEQLILNKITCSQDPRLLEITLNAGEPATFLFSINTSPAISLLDWKYFVFKAPRRKNYKDIDRQVDSFLKEESVNQKLSNPGIVSLFDWVYFTVETTENGLVSEFWIQMADEEISTPLRELFLGRKKGERFVVHNHGFEEYLSSSLIVEYPFIIIIHDIVPHMFFCLDLFKQFFKIKTQKDTHKKLIEIFSYRNDLSQRRSMVEDALSLLRTKHEIKIPEHLLLRQKKRILEAVQTNPDYSVYKRQPHFEQYLDQLALKQSQEIALVDQIAHKESIAITHDDLKGYLNLTKRTRTKEFLYFPIYENFKNGQAMPLVIGTMKQNCLREKVVNHIIYHLTKK